MCVCLSMRVYVCLCEGERQIMYINKGFRVGPSYAFNITSRRNKGLEYEGLYSAWI